eukprot:756779-Hanusia_phi.AAC.7
MRLCSCLSADVADQELLDERRDQVDDLLDAVLEVTPETESSLALPDKVGRRRRRMQEESNTTRHGRPSVSLNDPLTSLKFATVSYVVDKFFWPVVRTSPIMLELKRFGLAAGLVCHREVRADHLVSSLTVSSEWLTLLAVICGLARSIMRGSGGAARGEGESGRRR